MAKSLTFFDERSKLETSAANAGSTDPAVWAMLMLLMKIPDESPGVYWAVRGAGVVVGPS